MGKHTSTAKSAGKKQESPESSSSSYILYDRIDRTPLSVYMELVCDNNKDVLIIEGNPSDDVLEEAKNRLLEEAGEAMNDGKISIQLQRIKAYYSYRAQVQFLLLCMESIHAGYLEETMAELKAFGVRRPVPSNQSEIDSLLKYLESQSKMKTAKMNEAKRNYDELGSEDVKLTRGVFYDELATLSNFHKFNIGMDVMISQYISYKKMYNRAIERKKWKT